MKARSSSFEAVVEKLWVVTLVALAGWSPNAKASIARAGAVTTATVTLMAADVVEFPAPSRARAERVCPPSDVVVVSHVIEYGACCHFGADWRDAVEQELDADDADVVGRGRRYRDSRFPKPSRCWREPSSRRSAKVLSTLFTVT